MGLFPSEALKKSISEKNYELWIVVNANRPQTSNFKSTVELASKIEMTTRIESYRDSK